MWNNLIGKPNSPFLDYLLEYTSKLFSTHILACRLSHHQIVNLHQPSTKSFLHFAAAFISKFALSFSIFSTKVFKTQSIISKSCVLSSHFESHSLKFEAKAIPGFRPVFGCITSHSKGYSIGSRYFEVVVGFNLGTRKTGLGNRRRMRLSRGTRKSQVVQNEVLLAFFSDRRNKYKLFSVLCLMTEYFEFGFPWVE